MDHIVLKVSNFKQAITFYDVLFTHIEWAKVIDPLDKVSIGYRNGNNFTIWISEVQHLKTGPQLGLLDHLAFKCTSADEVNDRYNFCMAQNWDIISTPKSYPDYGNFYGFSFTGPDNLKLEFVSR